MTLVACIGGGQLGRMLGLAGLPLGLRFRFLDPSPDACAGEVGELVVGEYDDVDALVRLADGADVVTYEFENVPVEAARGVGAVPGSRALEQGQDRLREKELFRSLGIPTARFGTLAETGLPALVKSRRLGYDGKGQRRLDVAGAVDDGEIAEELVAFDRELSIVGVRDGTARRASGRSARTSTATGSCALTRSPVVDAPQAEAEAICTALLDALDYVGVLAVELFEVGGRLLANEFAPRVHNTAHWTIDGAETSQFENHLRAILGLPIGATGARAPCVMVNLIGAAPPLEELLALPGSRVHLYGKAPRAGRKVGHVTLARPGRGDGRAVDGPGRRGVRSRLTSLRLAFARACGAHAGARGSTPRAGGGPRRACTARSSPTSACPSISWTLRRSAPPSRRWVANECRNRCGWTRPGSSPARSASRRRMRNAPARVSAPPRALRNRSARWRRSRCGRPSAM